MLALKRQLATVSAKAKRRLSKRFLEEASDDQLQHWWSLYARDAQRAPPGDWTTWLIMGGRGSGKTRAGAEWIRAMATGNPEVTKLRSGYIALVGETYNDAREVMVEGQSGLLAIHGKRERPTFITSRRRLEWNNGAVAQLFSAEDPDGLRGPQFEIAWCDELAKWKHAQETWDMLQFGLRLGPAPRQVVTTTPKPHHLLKRLLADPDNAISRMSTAENGANLAAPFLQRIVRRYEGTRLGRQELDGELIEDRDDALWSRAQIEKGRRAERPPLERIVVAVDPPVTGHAKSDACGIIAAGKAADGLAYVIADETLSAVSPERWAKAAAALYHRLGADRLVVETNQGGDMAESVLRAADPTLAIRQVKASRGKWLRAEPVAHLYERGLVRHVGALPELEDEMCDFGLDGRSLGRSPDRLDALVWALTDLMLTTGGAPRARAL